jgi:fructose-bisphosphate aldolase class I
MRRAYRELLLGAPGLSQYVAKGQPFAAAMTARGILPGIKVDTGTVTLSGTDGEKITEGLDGLRGRVDTYRRLGARFAKWRAVYGIERFLRRSPASPFSPAAGATNGPRSISMR